MVFIIGPLWKKVSTYIENKFDVHFKASSHLVFNIDDDAVTPSLTLDGTNSGFYGKANNVLAISVNGTDEWIVGTSSFRSTSANSPQIMSATSSSTVPGFVFYGDNNTGLGRAYADGLSLIAGGVEGIRIAEASGLINTTLNGSIRTPSINIRSGPGAISIAYNTCHIVTTGADALTLADGLEGQHIYIIMKTDGGDGIVTPVNLANGLTLTFDNVGDCCQLLFTNGSWHYMGGTGVVIGV